MPADDPPGLNDWGAIDDRADRFHAAWASGPVRDWTPFLAGLSPAVRAAVLVELVMIDLGHRWGRGEQPLLEEYLARHPDLGPASVVPVKLVAEELRHRQATGDPWSSAEYERRFPAQYAQMSAGHDTMMPRPGAPGLTPHFGRTPGAEPPPVPLSPAAPGSGSSPAAEFEMVRRLGAGAFGEVWLARKRSTGIEKAVKIVTQPADREAALRERQALELIKNFRHPFLVATEDYWVASNRLHIVMELADGTLRGRLKDCQNAGLPGVPADELVGYVREVADGLGYLHSQGVIHRDIKPDNILLVNGHAKVADFGLARASEHAITSMTLAGSPGYMPPEVWGGQGGPASDQYSLAFVYAEARQGAPPLSADNFSELMFAHMDGQFAFSDVVGSAERQVLARALSRLPADRYPSCKAFADDLARALAAPGSFAPAGKPTKRPEPAPTPPKPRRKPVFLAAALVAGLGVLIGGLVIAALTSGPNPPTGGGGGGWMPGGAPTGDDPPPPPPPPPGDPVLPDKAVRPPEAKVEKIANGRRVFDLFDVPVNGVPVRFLLVPGGPVQNRDPVPPFYLSREKITDAAFGRGGAPGPSPPALNVTHAQARAFAESAFGGTLPTADQWDHAAGLFDRGGGTVAGTGPAQTGGGTPHVNAPGPRATTAGTADVGPHGHWDLSGNGREWTADPDPASGRVPLRGRSFTYRLPLDYAALAAERKQPQASHPNKPSPYTGFRVVVPVR